MKSFLSLFLFVSLFHQSLQAKESGPVLRGQIEMEAAAPHHGPEGHIQPGTEVKLIAVVTNEGEEKSPEGEVFIRFLYPEPLRDQKNSLLYQSESQKLPSLAPGQTIQIPFTKTHRWPSLLDFVRQDWPMRSYEAVLVFGNQEYISALRSITFSAYYYEGPPKKMKVKLPPQDKSQ